MTQSSGTAATSVEICAVTATRRPDGTAASADPARDRRASVGGAASAPSTVAAAGGASGRVHSSAPQAAISSDQHDEADRPQPGLIAEPDQRLDQHRIGEQREEAADIAGGIEEIRILRRRVVGAREPGLQQRAVGGEREERQPDRHREQAEQPERLARARRPAPAVGDRERQDEAGGDHHREMDDDRLAAGRIARQQVGIGIAASSAAWKNTIATDHTDGAPPSRGSTILVNIGCTANKQRGAEKDRGGERRQQQPVLRARRLRRTADRNDRWCSYLSWNAWPQRVLGQQQYRVRDILSGAACTRPVVDRRGAAAYIARP